MRLIRFGPVGAERPGILDSNDARRDAAGLGEDWNEAFFATNGVRRLATWLDSHRERLPIVPDAVRWAPCVARPSKIVCIGLNYRDHTRETGAPIPTEPILFAKSTSSLGGPYDDLLLPPNSVKTGW